MTEPAAEELQDMFDQTRGIVLEMIGPGPWQYVGEEWLDAIVALVIRRTSPEEPAPEAILATVRDMLSAAIVAWSIRKLNRLERAARHRGARHAALRQG